MKFIRLFPIILFLGACASNPIVVESEIPTNTKKELVAIKLETFKTIQSSIKDNSPALNLSQYKDIKFKVSLIDDITYVTITYDEFSKLLSMLQELSGRIEIQKASIDTLIDLYQNELVSQIPKDEDKK